MDNMNAIRMMARLGILPKPFEYIGGGGGTETTVTGVSPLVLSDARAKAIKSLVQYGKCTQASTPTPSAPVDIVCNNGAVKWGANEHSAHFAQYLNAYIKASNRQISAYNGNSVVTYDCEVGKTYHCYDGGASGNALSVNVGYSDTVPAIGTTYSADDFESVPCPDGYRTGGLIFTAKKRYVTFIFRYDGDSSKTPESMLSQMVFTEVGKEVGTLYIDGTPEALSVAAASDPRLPKGYIPLEYVENAERGYIDTGIIMNTADLDVEVDFQSTGDTSGQPKMAWGYMGASQNLPRWGIGTYQDAWLGSPNATVPRGTTDNNRHTIVMRVHQTESGYNIYDGTIDGTSLYSSASLSNVSLFLDNTLSAYLFARNNNGTAGNNFVGKIYGFKVTKADVVIHELIPCKNDSDVVGFYDIISHTFMGAIGTLTGEVKYTTIGTASVLDLFAVGDYADEAEIISGAVTRKVGIKVFDGTENWSMASTASVTRYRLSFADVVDGTGRFAILCSHFSYASSGQPIGGAFLSSKSVYVIPDQRLTTVDEFKSWLAAQYAAGTPVIVIYPLAVETTESVAPQALSTAEGDNIVSVTSNVDPVTLEATYYAKT